VSWKLVCKADAVAENSVKAFEVDGINVLLANLGAGGFRAYPPLCPHMEEPLAQSAICSAGVMTCTKHLWQWDMSTGGKLGPAEKPLLLYEVKQEGADVFILLEKELIYEYDEGEDDEDD
jgi:toluene monooxygenase system ferredoxin subunit